MLLYFILDLIFFLNILANSRDVKAILVEDNAIFFSFYFLSKQICNFCII